MKDALIITNGDAAADVIRKARLAWNIVPWRDPLHEGPVELTGSLEELSAARAQYLSARLHRNPEETRAEFCSRDAALKKQRRSPVVILWFDPDLYDQLQLIQLLDHFLSFPEEAEELCLIQAGTSIGQETPGTIHRHLALTQRVSAAQLQLAKTAWTRFRAPTPIAWAALLADDLAPLPFLRAAILRSLEDLPAPGSGLGRSALTALAILARGVRKPADLFAAVQEEEEAPFMGDEIFFRLLEDLAGGETPLVAGLAGDGPAARGDSRAPRLAAELSLTAFGADVLAGRTDALARRTADQWLGGSHIASGSLWRWDAGTRSLIAPAAPVPPAAPVL